MLRELRVLVQDLIAMAREEARRWKDPPSPEPSKPTVWNAEEYLERLKAESRCPMCAKPKTAGILMCLTCSNVREKWKRAS